MSDSHWFVAMHVLHMTFQQGLNILPHESEKGKKINKGLKKADKSNKSQSYYP